MKLKPTKVFANFLPGYTEAFSRKSDCESANDEQENSEAVAETVPCLLIPLTTDAQCELIKKVSVALDWEDGTGKGHEMNAYDVLAAAGIFPKRRRGSIPKIVTKL